ncbi:MAG: nucleoside deaminase [Firmicutes bacterium]|nr:nucleoside deaminase [Bacillota bacterium]
MQAAIQAALDNVKTLAGGPFGAVVVRQGVLVATGHNQVTALHDPTAHAEVQAIRAACRKLGHFQLTDCEIYTSCEPCPMCLGAIYWARPGAVYYAYSHEDAARAGFDDHFIYEQIALPIQDRSIPMIQLPTAGADPFAEWRAAEGRIEY